MPGNEEENRGSDGGVNNSTEESESNTNLPSASNGTTRSPQSAFSATNTNTTRAPSALHSRLLNQQRSNILLQVLFHHMLNSRRRREEQEALALDPPPLPDREMAILSHDEAIASNAMCRFCFEGSTEIEGEDITENSSSSNSNALVAPCDCAGGSRWVHLECLRQWQRLQARSLSNSNILGGDNENQTTTYTAAGYICNVCNSPYLSRPPAVRSVRRQLLKRGTLLVSKPNVGRTFQQSVVLLLSDVCGNSQGTVGLIVNSPLQEVFTPAILLQQGSSAATSTTNEDDNTNNDNSLQTTDNNSNNTVIEYRRGGPVCGGRLGVVHYTVLHTYPSSFVSHPEDVLDVDIDEEYFEENEPEGGSVDVDYTEFDDSDLEVPLRSDNEEDGQDEDIGDLEDEDEIAEEEGDNNLESNTSAPLSLPVFDVAHNTPPLQFVASPHSLIPSTFSEDSLGLAVQQLVQNGGTGIEEQAGTSNDDNDNENNEPNKVIVFSGYCKWRAGQLEREIQREVWDVCIDATPEDILRHHGSGFWEELSESDRLLSWQRLIEEGEGADED